MGYAKYTSVCFKGLPQSLCLYGLEAHSSDSGNKSSLAAMGKLGIPTYLHPFLLIEKVISNDLSNSKLVGTVFLQSNYRPVYRGASSLTTISRTFGRSQGAFLVHFL